MQPQEATDNTSAHASEKHNREKTHNTGSQNPFSKVLSIRTFIAAFEAALPGRAPPGISAMSVIDYTPLLTAVLRQHTWPTNIPHEFLLEGILGLAQATLRIGVEFPEARPPLPNIFQQGVEQLCALKDRPHIVL